MSRQNARFLAVLLRQRGVPQPHKDSRGSGIFLRRGMVGCLLYTA